MERDAIDLGSVNVFKLFNKYFIPTLLGMLSMSAVTAIDGIFVGHGVGSDGVAAINICIPVLMLLMGVALMLGAGCSVVSSIHMAWGKQRVARMNVTQTLVFATLITLLPVGRHHALSRYHGTLARLVRPSVTVGKRLLAVVHSLSSV